MMCHLTKHVAVHFINLNIICIAQARRILCNGFQHRLNISWRTGDDTQDVTSSCLLFERFSDFMIACLQFIEEADIFNCNSCLICKNFEQGNLFVSEWINLSPADHDRADHLIFTHERCDKHSALFACLVKLLTQWELVWRLIQQVFNVDRFPLHHCPASNGITIEWYAILKGICRYWHRTPMRNKSIATSINLHDGRVI